MTDYPHMVRPQASWLPSVVETTSRGIERWDLPSRMLDEHIVWLSSPINDEVSSAICLQLIWLEYKNADKDIQFYINSPGGDITALFAIYDTMQYVKNDIQTICFGAAYSAAAVLLAGGTKGKRLCLPHARIMLHQPWGGVGGQAADIEIQAKEILRMRQLIDQILHHHTGQPMDRISKDTDRDFYMSADEAKDYGIIDDVITNRELAAVPQAAGVA
jgi:ATP-dependent Clp protease protease subunit